MKRITLAVLLFVPFLLNAQNAYYDAIKLRTLYSVGDDKLKIGDSVFINIPDIPEVHQILQWYVTPEKSPIDSMEKSFRYNPFLRFDPNASKGAFTSLVQSGIGALGNLDVTNIADGLARFLIKRGKEELNIAFFERMKKYLDDHVEARTLFPATTTFLASIASYRYSEFLQSLREAFYKDVSSLIVNLNLLIDLPKYQQLLKTLPEIRLAIRSAKIISALSQPDSSLHPAILINHFAQLSEWGEMNINLQSSWQVLDKISESVTRVEYSVDTTRSLTVKTVPLTKDTFMVKMTQLSPNLFKTDTTKISAKGLVRVDSVVLLKYDTTYNKDVAWIRFSDFNQNILRDTITLRIYLGLLYQKMQNIGFHYAPGKDTSVQDFMRDNADNILKIADLIENFLVLANDVEQTLKDIKAKKSNLTNDDYSTYIEKAINVVDYGFKVANVIEEGIANDRYIVMARNANNLYKNIYTKNYNAAVMNAYLILQEVLEKPKEAIAAKDSALAMDTTNRISAPAKTSFAAAKSRLDIGKFFSLDSIKDRSKFVEGALKYGNVMASIVKSQSPEEAQAAIEAAVLPAGSSSIKKNSAWNISLNAYIGGYFGRSFNNTDQIDGSNSKVGVTAPVGFAVSKGLGFWNDGRTLGSLSAYFTVIDVGAIAGYRLNDDSTALEQKVTLNDIFAPGGYLVYGIGLPFKKAPYIPLSVGYGWQYGSKLYYKNDEGKLLVSDKSRWRSNWFVAIDIPLANFWTKSYRKK
ncbi:hypothetical protein QEG73_23850 [Chitinophagaceae bacterium 26-R-25]|nr:hypothetical protein [Chitinophagaceae bacterium 26-R-25]